MYVQELRLKNFRSLVNVELKDLPPLIVLFGSNGSGKSNILAALETIFCQKLQSGYQVGAPESLGPFYRGLITDFHHNYYRNTPCQVSFEVVLRTSLEQLRNVWPEGLKEKVFALPAETPPDRVRINLSGRFDPEPELPRAAQIFVDSAKVNNTPVYELARMPEPWLPQSKDKIALAERERIGEGLLGRLTGIFSTIGLGRFLRRENFPGPQEGKNAEMDLSSSFKTRLFQVKHSQLQAEQDKYRRILELFNNIAKWGHIDFAQVGADLDVMTWDGARLWLPVARRGAGAEQLLVLVSEVILRGASIIGIEELESNLDENHQKKLYDFLEQLVNAPGSGVGQIIATAHSYFYGHELLPEKKRFVRIKEDGHSVVESWTKDASKSLFQPWEYYQQLERERGKEKPKRKAKG